MVMRREGQLRLPMRPVWTRELEGPCAVHAPPLAMHKVAAQAGLLQQCRWTL
ncbi:hypothetical protein [Mumia zhuanghuii]|uniref:hypothetical protein n=1 Tax=Mumia zhuanghuii TaxID=2585211 RepID=UPI00129C9C01|nr:hypothetical protein [Mumia zhuanghuii]